MVVRASSDEFDTVESDRSPLDPDGTGLETHDRLHTKRFVGAGFTDDAKNLLWLEFKAQILQRLLENDVNVAARGEQWQGDRRDISHFVFVALGTGIGMGIVNEGRIIRCVSWREPAKRYDRDQHIGDADFCAVDTGTGRDGQDRGRHCGCPSARHFQPRPPFLTV
jgi:hypothetical protein